MKLHISDKLSLPLNAVTQKLAMLGRTGSGKTYGATKLAEEMLDAGAQIVALDPVGAWYGLRLAANGRDAGIAIPVFGGLHGDVPLEPSAGALIADLIVDRGISAICDVSQFEHDTDKSRFGRDFAARFFFRKKSAPSAVHVFMEECQEFIPEKTQKGEEHMLHAFTRMWKLGRNVGIGGTLISQRPQEVNKKALNLTECVFAFQLTGPHERKALKGWIAEKGLDEDIDALLPKLKIGEARVWSPSWLNISETVKIAEKRTFNASSTPEVGSSAKVRTLAPIDLERIRVDMAATIEKAKGEDPRELKKQIADLKKQLAAKGSEKKPAAVADGKEFKQGFEKGVLTAERTLAQRQAGTDKRLRDYLIRIRKKLIAALAAWGDEPTVDIDEALEVLRTNTFEIQPEKPHHLQIPAPPAPKLETQTPARPTSPAKTVEASSLGKGDRQILAAIAQYPDGATRQQLTVLTGYKRSTRDRYIQYLTAAGRIVISGDRIRATESGIEALGPDFQPLPTGDELRQHWFLTLPDGEAKLLKLVCFKYPETASREMLTEETGYQRSTRDRYIQYLQARQLVEAVGRGEVRASAELFE